MPPIVLEILVDADKGVVNLKQFDKAVADTSKSVQQGSQAQTQATQSSTALSSSLLAATKSAAGLALGFTGVGAIATTIGSVTTAVVDFEREMANVNTLLGKDSAGQLAALREQILALSPALGDSTTLAKGLYSALSAGIEAGQAVEFVATAAKAAKAGMADLSVATDALATVMQGYKLDATDATRVSDLMFQTVNVGKGTFQEFSRAFATVAPIASTMGISLEEVSATLGTLSFAFPSAAEGATGLRSVLTSLIQNADKFAAIGIDVQKVIREEGLTGLFKRLTEATKSNLTAVRELVPGVEGLQAVLATTGPLAAKQAQNLQVMATAAGSTGEAFKKTQDTVSASVANLGNQLTQVASTAAPAFLTSVKAITNALAGALKVGIAGTSTVFNEASFAILKAGEALGLNGQVARVTTDENARLNEQIIKQKVVYDAATEATIAATAAAKKQAEALQAAYTGLGVKSSEQLQLLANTALSNFQKILAAGTEPPERLAVLYEDLVKQMRAAFGTVPPAVQELGVAIRKLQDSAVKPLADQLDKAFAELGLKSSKALVESAEKGTQALQKLVDAGQLSAQQLAPAFDKVAERWEGLSTTIPAAVEQVAVSIGQQFQAMAASGQIPPSLIREQWQTMRDRIIAMYGELPPALKKLDQQITGQVDTTTRGIQEAYKRLGVTSREDLQKIATNAIAAFKTLLASGTATTDELRVAFQRMVEDVNRAGFKQMPEDFTAAVSQFGPVAKKAGDGVVKIFRDAQGDLKVVFEGMARDGKHAFETIDTSVLQTRGALERAKGAVDSLEGSTRGLSETAIMLGHSLNAAGKEVNAYGNDIAALTKATQDLMNAKIVVDTAFAGDEEGIRKQIAETQKIISDITSGTGPYLGVTLQNREALLKRYNDILAKEQAILDKILAANKEQTSATGTLTGTGTTAPSSPPTAPGATSTRPTGGTTAPITTGTRPTGGATTRPTVPETTTQRGVTVNVSLNAQMLTADRATVQQVVQQLTPAINEAIRRGEIR